MDHQFDNNLKGFILMNIWTILKNLKEKLPRKEKFYSSWTGKKVSDRISTCSYVLEQIWNENDERLSQFAFQMWRFTVSRYLK